MQKDGETLGHTDDMAEDRVTALIGTVSARNIATGTLTHRHTHKEAATETVSGEEKKKESTVYCVK